MASERRLYILRLLEERGSLRSAELADELGVTDETVRTDLVLMQRQGLLRRVHGGAVYLPPTAQPGEADASRLDMQMAALAAEQLRAGMSLVVDDGPLLLALALQLRERPCRLISAAPDFLAQPVLRRLPHELYCPGGRCDASSGLLLPDHPAEALRCLHPDAALLLPDAVTPQGVGYRSRGRLLWAAAAVASAPLLLIAAPARCLEAEAAASAPFTLALNAELLLTELPLPAPFDGGGATLPARKIAGVPRVSPPLTAGETDEWGS